MIVFLAEVLRPELLDSTPELKPAEVEAGTALEEVKVCAMLLPLIISVVTTTIGEKVLAGGAVVVVVVLIELWKDCVVVVVVVELEVDDGCEATVFDSIELVVVVVGVGEEVELVVGVTVDWALEAFDVVVEVELSEEAEDAVESVEETAEPGLRLNCRSSILVPATAAVRHRKAIERVVDLILVPRCLKFVQNQENSWLLWVSERLKGREK
jgi:hypothetical protein